MSRFTTIDLPSLPAMQALETISTEAIISARMARLKTVWTEHDPPAGAAYDVESLEFDPLKVQAEMAAYFELMVRDRVNQACRAVTLAYGYGSDLDAIASRYPGGIPRLPGESDDRYRRRIWNSVNALSPHGSAGAYVFWALTADATLRDVSAITIRPSLRDNPIILITCLAEGADPRPTTTQLLDVRRSIQAEARQGITDVISVSAPKVREIDYKVELWLYPGPDATTLMNSVRASVDALIEKQRWLGFDHTLKSLYGAVDLAGVARAVVLEPATDVLIEPDWIVKVKNVTLTLKGRTE